MSQAWWVMSLGGGGGAPAAGGQAPLPLPAVRLKEQRAERRLELIARFKDATAVLVEGVREGSLAAGEVHGAQHARQARQQQQQQELQKPKCEQEGSAHSQPLPTPQTIEGTSEELSRRYNTRRLWRKAMGSGQGSGSMTTARDKVAAAALANSGATLNPNGGSLGGSPTGGAERDGTRSSKLWRSASFNARSLANSSPAGSFVKEQRPAAGGLAGVDALLDASGVGGAAGDDRQFYLDPRSRHRVAWDLLVIAVVFYSVLV